MARPPSNIWSEVASLAKQLRQCRQTTLSVKTAQAIRDMQRALLEDFHKDAPTGGNHPKVDNHPWDIPHPLIERVPGGWRRKGDDHIAMHPSRPEFGMFAPEDERVRAHPVLFLLFIIQGRGLAAIHRNQLKNAFLEGSIISDEEIKALPCVLRWTKAITNQWPELRRRYGTTRHPYASIPGMPGS